MLGYLVRWDHTLPGNKSIRHRCYHPEIHKSLLAAIVPSEPQTFTAWSSVRRAISDAAAELWNAADEAAVVAILQALTTEANDLVAEVK